MTSLFGQVAVTFQSIPPTEKGHFKVVGANCQPGVYSTPATLTWTAGPDCTVETLLPPESGGNSRYAFQAWDDQDKSKIRAIPVPAVKTTRELRLQQEFKLATQASPPGSATMYGSGWHPEGLTVRVQAVPQPGYVFLNWGSLSFGGSGYDPPWVEFILSGPPTVTAVLRSSTTAPLPHQFSLTVLNSLADVHAGSFNQSGSIVGTQYRDPSVGQLPTVWVPETPNSPFGTMRFLEGLPMWENVILPKLNDDGRILNVAKGTTRIAIWTPSAPGSPTGVETAINDASRSTTGRTAGFNRYGQASVSYSGLQQQALWTPNSPGATSGTSFVDSRFGNAWALNNYGQVLSTAEFGSEGAAFRLFTPSSPNSGTGTFTSVPIVPGGMVNQVRALSPLGAVGGVWCTPLPAGECPMEGYLWQPDQPNGSTGQLTKLAAPAGFGEFIRIASVNSSADLVGTLNHPLGQVPFVRLKGVIYDLMQVPGVVDGFQPIAINDAGQILMQQGNNDILLLTPRAVAPTPPADAVSVTIDSNVPTAGFTVSGAACQPGAYFTPRTLRWNPGANCQIQWSSTVSLMVGRRLRFGGWTDGAAGNTRIIPAPAAATTYTAAFVEEVEVVLRVQPANAGTVAGGGWVAIGTNVTVSAVANPGFSFQAWSGPDGPNSAAPAQFAATRPTIYTALFSALSTGPYSYTLTRLTGMANGKVRLNNYGQVLFAPDYGSGPVLLWTPDQPQSASGSTTSLPGFLPANASFSTSSLLLDDFGRIAVKPSGHPLVRWTPTAPNGRQGSYSPFVEVPGHAVSWVRHMNSYGQLFGAFVSGNTNYYGIWTPSSPNAALGSLVQNQSYDRMIKGNEYGQFVADYPFSAPEGFRLFTPSAPNSSSGTFDYLKVLPPLDSMDTVALNNRGAVAFNVITRFSAPSYTRENLSYIWKPDVNNGNSGQVFPIKPPVGYSVLSIYHMNNFDDVAGRVLRNGASYVPFVMAKGQFFIPEGIPGLPDPFTISAFNDAGQLVAEQSTAQGPSFFLLTPNVSGGACPVSTVRSQEHVGPAGGRLTLNVNSASTCQWTASSNADWLSITGASTGTGSGTVVLGIPKNDSGAARQADVMVNGTRIGVRQAHLSTVSLYPSSLTLVVSPKGVAAPQEVRLLMADAGPVTWRLASANYNLRLDHTTGSVPDRITVSYTTASGPPTQTQVAIQLDLTGAEQASITLPVTLAVQPTGTVARPPFGSFDTPTDGAANLAGSVAVTGWALDDIGVNKVTIWRDPVGPEPTHSNGYVYIGDALFVRGSRPDVEAKYPTSPNADRSGWGYMLLTNPLPGKGNGTFKLHAIATDWEGNSVKLGTKTVTVNNLRATKPFGAIDTPAPGELVSGAISNSGWVLTPQPAAIPIDGSTIWVSVDGVYLGHPTFGAFRPDVAGIFPGYANTDSSAGQYLLDSTKLANSMHTIAWIVSDNQGRGDGMGSRFFDTQNAVQSLNAGPILQAEREFQFRAARVLRSSTAVSYPAFRRGYHRDAALTPIRRAGDGLLEPIQINELDRLELHLPAGQQWTALQRVGEELRDLPIGSTFDAEGGIFYWQLGPAFLGEFALEFRAADGAVLVVPIRVGVTAPTNTTAIADAQ